MGTMTSVSIPFAVARQVDAWAERRGLPSGPGRRTTAVREILLLGLAANQVGRDGK